MTAQAGRTGGSAGGGRASTGTQRLVALVQRSRAIGNRVHALPMSRRVRTAEGLAGIVSELKAKGAGRCIAAALWLKRSGLAAGGPLREQAASLWAHGAGVHTEA